MKLTERFLQDDLAGVHFAVNVFIATSVLWVVLRRGANLNPIWAISSMIAATDLKLKQALATFKGRIVNAAVGSLTGLTFLVVGGQHEIALPVALAVTVLVSTYFVRVQVMWRQAPITAAIVIAAGWTHRSEVNALEIGGRRVGEVMLGCVIGVGVSWLMSKLWPAPDKDKSGELRK